MASTMLMVVAASLSFLGTGCAAVLEARGPCAGNTPATRSEWCGFSVDSDYTREAPDTGRTREYWLEITDVVVSPDGVSRPGMAVNGSIPGPTIHADWGDTVVVHVKNSLYTSMNGTSIHFHGIRQNYTNQNDGVVSITQCPTAVGETETYTWRAVQYGSSWYHSHFALQAWEGVFGGIVINGPATANYDKDLGSLFLNDWDHSTIDEQFVASRAGGAVVMANGLINGTNVYEDGGQRLNVSFTSGSSHRLRLVNAAASSHFKFSIDHHTMTVIAADFVPIEPFTTKVLDITMGQRYDVVVVADQAHVAQDFWMRAIPQTSCSLTKNSDNIRAIVHYGQVPSEPSTTGHAFVDSCDDEANVVPHLKKDAGSADEQTSEVVSTSGFFWTLNSTAMEVKWKDPTLKKLIHQTSFENSNAVIELPKANIMFYLVIMTDLPLPHPVHLHGHDFFVLAQGTGRYSPETVLLKTQNPTRRDTAILPGSGFLVLGFETDNPGAWLMHCHIGFHVSRGFGLQFLERADEIPALTDKGSLERTCDAWSSFQSLNSIEQEDSGV